MQREPPRPAPVDLLALAEKYRELTEMRRRHARGEAAPSKEVFVRLAQAHPGALYELDRLSLDEIVERERALRSAASGGEIAPWMRWMTRYHRLVAEALIARRLAPRDGPRPRPRASASAIRAIAEEEGVEPDRVSRALFGRHRRGIEG